MPSPQHIQARTNHRRAITLVALLALAVDALVVRSLSLLAPLIRSALAISESQFGYGVGALMLGTFLATLPAGVLVGKLNARRTYITLMAALGIGLSIVASQRSYTGLIMALFLVGILRAGLIPLVNRLVAENFDRERRGATIGFIFAAVPLGGFLASVVLPALGEAIAWWAGYALIGVLAILSAICSRLVLPAGEYAHSSQTGLINFDFLHTKSFLILALTYAFFSLSTTVEAFITLYLVDVVKLTALAAGTFYGLIHLTGIGGRMAWGMLADHGFKNNRWWLLGITSAVATASFALFIQLTPQSSTGLIALSMAGFGLSLASSWSILTTLTGDIVDSGSVASATATIFFMTNLADSGGPVLFGNALAWTHSYQKSVSLFMGITILTAFSFFGMAVKNHRQNLFSIPEASSSQ